MLAIVIIKISLLWVVNSLHKLYTAQSSQRLCEETAFIVFHVTVEQAEAQWGTPPAGLSHGSDSLSLGVSVWLWNVRSDSPNFFSSPEHSRPRPLPGLSPWIPRWAERAPLFCPAPAHVAGCLCTCRWFPGVLSQPVHLPGFQHQSAYVQVRKLKGQVAGGKGKLGWEVRGGGEQHSSGSSPAPPTCPFSTCLNVSVL